MTPAPQTEDLIAQLEALIDKVTITEPWHAREGWPALQDGFVVCALFAEEPHLPVLRDAAAFVVTQEDIPDEQLPHLAELLARCSPANLRTLLDALSARSREVERLKQTAQKYSCPVCGSGDPNAYLRCNRPDCTDGRDPRPQALEAPHE